MRAMTELAGAAEIGVMLGISRQRVQQLIGRPDFPQPVQVLAMGKVWTRSEIVKWAQDHGREVSS